MTQLTLDGGFEPATSMPVFCWPGGKERLLTEIMPLMPTGLTEMVSPFVGGGAVELGMAAAGVRVHASDAHPVLTSLWRVLLTDPARVADRLVEARAYNKEQFRQLIEFADKPPDEQGISMFFRLFLTLYGGPTSKTLLLDTAAKLTTRKERHLRQFRAPMLTVDRRDYREALAARPHAFAYLDPPYVDPDGYAYKNLYGSGDHFDHEEFANLLLARDSAWVLSINDCQWVRDRYADCDLTPLQLKWTVGLREGKEAERRGELLIRPRLA